MREKIIHMEEHFKGTPHGVFEALMNPKKHSEFTGSPAIIDRNAGGAFSHWDGHATGVNEVVLEDIKIVQTWRARNWPEGVTSKVTYHLFPEKNGTKLLFIHEGVPQEFIKEIKQAWSENYWQPLHKYFG